MHRRATSLGSGKLSYTTPEGPEESTADLTMEKDGTVSGTVVSKRGYRKHHQRLSQRRHKFSFTINIPLDQGPTDATLQRNVRRELR